MKRNNTRVLKLGMNSKDLNEHFNDNFTRERFLRGNFFLRAHYLLKTITDVTNILWVGWVNSALKQVSNKNDYR